MHVQNVFLLSRVRVGWWVLPRPPVPRLLPGWRFVPRPMMPRPPPGCRVVPRPPPGWAGKVCHPHWWNSHYQAGELCHAHCMVPRPPPGRRRVILFSIPSPSYICVDVFFIHIIILYSKKMWRFSWKDDHTTRMYLNCPRVPTWPPAIFVRCSWIVRYVHSEPSSIKNQRFS